MECGKEMCGIGTFNGEENGLSEKDLSIYG